MKTLINCRYLRVRAPEEEIPVINETIDIRLLVEPVRLLFAVWFRTEIYVIVTYNIFIIIFINAELKSIYYISNLLCFLVSR